MKRTNENPKPNLARTQVIAGALLLLLACASAAPQAKEKSHPVAPKAGAIRVGHPTAKQITNLLHEFLSKVDDVAMHDRFWADDLIYTAASGKVRSKADILKDMRAGQTPGNRDNAKATYDAEDIQVREFGGVAVLNFRLVAHVTKDGKEAVNHYRNSGTFVRNKAGEWQAVSWQATKEEEKP